MRYTVEQVLALAEEHGVWYISAEDVRDSGYANIRSIKSAWSRKIPDHMRTTMGKDRFGIGKRSLLPKKSWANPVRKLLSEYVKGDMTDVLILNPKDYYYTSADSLVSTIRGNQIFRKHKLHWYMRGEIIYVSKEPLKRQKAQSKKEKSVYHRFWTNVFKRLKMTDRIVFNPEDYEENYASFRSFYIATSRQVRKNPEFRMRLKDASVIIERVKE